LEPFKLDEPPFNKIPFIRIMNDRKNNFWTAPAHSQHYCLGKSESQCEYSLACALFAESLQQRIENNPNLGFMLDEPLAQLEIYKQQDTKVWAKALDVKATIVDEFNSWWAPFSEAPLMQAAIHIRRGDHMYLNRNVKAHQARSAQESELIFKQWSDTDEQVEARVHNANHVALALRTRRGFFDSTTFLCGDPFSNVMYEVALGLVVALSTPGLDSREDG
jgi:hypothetical protein